MISDLGQRPYPRYGDNLASGENNRVVKAVRSRFTVVAAASSNSVDLAAMKVFLRITSNDQDEVISALISACETWAEQYIGRSIMSRICAAWYDSPPNFSDTIEIPYGPASAVASVKYFTEDDTETTLGTTVYRTDLIGIPPRIVLKSGQSWPTSLRSINALKVNYTAGYADADSVPAPIKDAIKLIVADLFESRGAQATAAGFGMNSTVPKAALVLLDQYKSETL